MSLKEISRIKDEGVSRNPLFVICLNFIKDDGDEYYEEFHSVHETIENAKKMVENIVEESQEKYGSIYDGECAFITIDETTTGVHDRKRVYRT